MNQSRPEYPKRWIVKLVCGHTRSLLVVNDPQIGGEAFCAWCRASIHITQVDAEFNVKCLDCTSRKYTGLSLLTAQMFADKHSRKQPLHRIQLRSGTTVIEIRAPKINLGMLSFGVASDPPF